MYKKNLFTIACALFMMLGFVACHEPIYSEAPIYDNLKLTTESASKITLDNQGSIKVSSICNPGDSVTVFMRVKYTGAYITEADYSWKMYVTNDSIVSKSIKVIAPHKQNTPPMWTFKAPEVSGKYTLSFKANYDYSAQTEVGQIYGESPTYRVELNVK